MNPLLSEFPNTSSPAGRWSVSGLWRSLSLKWPGHDLGTGHHEPGILNRMFIQLFLFFLIAALMPLNLFIVHSYNLEISDLKDRLDREIEEALFDARMKIESLMEHHNEILGHLSKHLIFKNDSEKSWDIIAHDAETSGFQEVMAVNSDGIVVFSWPNRAYVKINTLSGVHVHIPWIDVTVKSLSSHDTQWTPPTSQVLSTKPVAYVSHPVMDPQGNLQGVITGAVKKQVLEASLFSISERFGNTSFHLFSNEPRAILSVSATTNDQEETGKFQTLKTDLTSDTASSIWLETPLDDRITHDSPWILLAKMSTAPLSRARNDFLIFALAFITGTVLLVFLLALVAARGTTQAINVYRLWADQTVNGNLIELERPNSRHEIAMLGKSLSDISLRMRDIVRFCSAASVGDFSQPFPDRGSHDHVAMCLNGIRDYFTIVAEAIGQIADGRYALVLPQRSGHDVLGPKLTNLARALSAMNEDNMRQIASTLAQMELVRYVSGDRDLNAMSDQLLSFLCQYLKAQTGIFYLFDREQELYRKSAGFGIVKPDYPETILPGEYLCGQAISEKTFILIVPDEKDHAPAITFGFHSEKSRSVLAFPFTVRDEVIGAVELGSLGSFTSEHLDFLKKNNESIAIGFHSAQHRDLTEKLLAKTLEQSQRMKRQQEELSTAYKELAAQTEALKKSEARLIASETDLKNANTALEAHSKRLEDQKRFLDRQNRELEETKTVLELKAEELSRSNRYKSEFLANMSHELRTPLNSIILLSNLLNGHLENIHETKHAKFASIINTSGKDLMNLINEVLDLTKVTSGDMPVNLVRYELKEIEKILKHWYLKQPLINDIEFSITLDENLPDVIQTDPLKLERILKSLLSNAFKYTEKGSVAVEIRRPGKNRELPLKGMDPDHTVEFSITDTGQGIPFAMQDYIFEAFRQVDGSITRKHGGTGLGLSLAQEFSRLLKGKIVLTHSDESGSVFSLFLPVKPMGRP